MLKSTANRRTAQQAENNAEISRLKESIKNVECYLSLPVVDEEGNQVKKYYGCNSEYIIDAFKDVPIANVISMLAEAMEVRLVYRQGTEGKIDFEELDSD